MPERPRRRPQLRTAPERTAEPVSPVQLLDWLDELRRAVRARDPGTVQRLLDCREANWAPRDVREEALGMAGLPTASLRAPLALLRFAHQLQQLVRAGEPMPGVGRPAGDARLAGPEPQLELVWRPQPVLRRDRDDARRRPA